MMHKQQWFTIFVMVLSAFYNSVSAQNSISFRSVKAGNWTDTAVWEVFDQGHWRPCGMNEYPNADTADARVSHELVYDRSLQSVRHLYIDSSGKIFTANPNQFRYLYLFGNIKCDGQLGNGDQPDADGIGISLEGRHDTIEGSGQFHPNRVRKELQPLVLNSGQADTSTLVWKLNGSIVYSGTGLYCDAARFLDFKLMPSCSLHIHGDASIDQISGLNGTTNARGLLDIYGYLHVKGNLFLRNNNSSRSFDTRVHVRPNGVLRVGKQLVGKGTSTGDAWSIFMLDSASVLQLDTIGSPMVSFGKCDSLAFHPDSEVHYSARGQQKILAKGIEYGNLYLDESGVKSLTDSIIVKGDLCIRSGASLDATDSNYQIRIHGNWINQNASADGFYERNCKVVFEGTSGLQQLISMRGNEVFAKLVLANDSGLALSKGDVFIKDTLQLEKGVLLSSDSAALQMQNGSRIWPEGGREKSFVSGTMRWEIESADSILFPIGDANKGIRARFYLQTRYPDQRSEKRVFRISYAAHAPENDSMDAAQHPMLKQLSQNEFWSLEELSNASGNDLEFKIRTYWHDGSGVSQNTYERHFLAVAKWDSLRRCWSRASDPLHKIIWNHSSSEGWIESQWQQQSAQFTLAEDSTLNPLPVDLLYFKAKCSDGSAPTILWATASETNSERFELLFSDDGKQYKQKLVFDAAGWSQTIEQYKYQPLKTYGFALLRQVDYDGKIEAFGPIALNPCRTVETGQIEILEKTRNQWVLSSPGKKLWLRNLQGHVMKSGIKNELGLFVINIMGVPSGVYLINDDLGNHLKLWLN